MKKPMILTKRPSTPITIRMPVDVLEDLKRVAPLKGMSGYQALIKFYISQGLRDDLRSIWEEEQGKELESTLNEFGLKQEQKQRIWNLIPSLCSFHVLHRSRGFECVEEAPLSVHRVSEIAKGIEIVVEKALTKKLKEEDFVRSLGRKKVVSRKKEKKSLATAEE